MDKRKIDVILVETGQEITLVLKPSVNPFFEGSYVVAIDRLDYSSFIRINKGNFFLPAGPTPINILTAPGVRGLLANKTFINQRIVVPEKDSD